MHTNSQRKCYTKSSTHAGTTQASGTFAGAVLKMKFINVAVDLNVLCWHVLKFPEV
jgi:hypothetical protein